MPPGVGYSVPNSGASHYPPSFSNFYNPNIGQQNLGSQATAGLMGGVQSMPGMLTGLGMASSLGLLGQSAGMYSLGGAATKALGVGSVLDPFGMALRAGSAGAQFGGGLAARMGAGSILGGVGAGIGGIAGAALPAAALYAGYKGVAAFGTGGVHQAEINRMFSGYNFANPNALGGRGFNARQMGRIGDAMHSMDASSSFISGGDAMQLTKQFQQMGLGRGAESVSDLTNKLKEFGRVADEVAQRMGTSITEVSGLIQKMRGTGFFSSSEIAGNVTNMRTMETMGVSNEQFLGAQQQAGSMSRGMGLTNTAGANFISAAGGQMVSALQSGTMDQEQMMRLTGTDHYADAGMAFAQKMQGGLGNFMRSGVGRAFLAGIGQTKGGKFTGKIDSNMLDKLSSGGDFDSIMDRGRNALQGRDAGRTFMTNQDSMLDDLMGSEQGLTSMVGAVTSMAEKANLGDGEDAFVLLGKRMQIGTEMELRELHKFADQQKKIRANMLRKKARELSTERFQTRMARNRFSGKVSEAMGAASDMFLGGITHAGQNFMTSGSSMFEDIDIAVGEFLTKVKRDTFASSQTSIDDVNRRLTLGERVGSATTNVNLDSVEMESTLLGPTRDLGVMGGASANKALMLQRAGATKNFSAMTSLIESSLPPGRKEDLDKKLITASSNTVLQKLIGEAREAKLSGNSGALGDKIEAVREHMVNTGLVDPGSSGKDMQYILSKIGGEDVVARDLANATVSLSGGETKAQKEDKAFREAIMGEKGTLGSGTKKALGVAGGVGGGILAGAGMVAGGVGLMSAAGGVFATGMAANAVFGVGLAMSGLGAVAAGTKLGAAAGSVVPVLGTLAGAAVGAIAGYALYDYMKPEEQEIMEEIMDNGTGVDLLGSLKSPAEQAEFSQLLEEYKKAADSEDEAYEMAAKAFSAKYGKKITAKDVRTSDKAMTHMSGKNSSQRAQMSVSDFANNKGLKQLMGYTRFKASTKARAKVNQQMMDSISKEGPAGLLGEAKLMDALGMKEGDTKDDAMKVAINEMIDKAVTSGNFSASDTDPTLKRAITKAATIRRDISQIEGSISEEDLAKKVGVSLEDVQAFRQRTGGTGLVTKNEITQLGELLSENVARGVLTEGAAGVGMTTGGEFAGTDAELQSKSMQQTAFMIDALYAKATGATSASTAGGQRVLTNMNQSKPDRE